MKKQPGINGDYILLSREERLSNATSPTLVSLGTPAAVQTLYAFSRDQGPVDWILPLILWLYGLVFWFNSEGLQLVKAKHWQWTEEAIEEQQRYMSDTRIASRRFWGHWWVRFPVGLLFLSVGVHAMFSKDFSAQWISFILLMSAFVTPFVFIAELAMLPVAILVVLGLMAVVTFTPTSVIIMLAVLGLFATLVMAQNIRAKQPPKKTKKEDKKEEPVLDKPAEPAKSALPALAEPVTEASVATAAAEALAASDDVPSVEITPTAEVMASEGDQASTDNATSETDPDAADTSETQEVDAEAVPKQNA
jgi:membrane protein implicated in regulation of membrane protease activity